MITDKVTKVPLTSFLAFKRAIYLKQVEIKEEQDLSETLEKTNQKTIFLRACSQTSNYTVLKLKEYQRQK